MKPNMQKAALFMGSKTSKNSHTTLTFPSISSRYTSDDANFLWMKGRSDLTILNVESMADFTFNMWDFDDKKRKTKGLFTVAARNGKKIFGVTNDINSSYMLIFVRFKTIKPSKSKSPSPSRSRIGGLHIDKVCLSTKAFQQHSKSTPILTLLSQSLVLCRGVIQPKLHLRRRSVQRHCCDRSNQIQ